MSLNAEHTRHVFGARNFPLTDMYKGVFLAFEHVNCKESKGVYGKYEW